MTATCLVKGCKSRSKKGGGISFHQVPTVLKHKHKTKINELSAIRRDHWIKAIKRTDLFEKKLKNLKVCSLHFVTGKPAALEDIENPDWVPSQKLGGEIDIEMWVPPADLIRLVRVKRIQDERNCKMLKIPKIDKNDNICRICMRNNLKNLNNLLEMRIPDSNRLLVCDLITRITNVNIEKDDCLPKFICDLCYDDVLRTHCLIETCKNSDKKLKAIFQEEIKEKMKENCSAITQEDNNDKMKENSSAIVNTIIITTEPVPDASKLENVLPQKPETINKEFKCGICLETYESAESLDEHVKSHIRNIPDENELNNMEIVEPDNAVKSLLECKTCEETFSNNNDEIATHSCVNGVVNNDDKNLQQVYACRKCDNTFITLRSLNMHIRQHNVEEGIEGYHCDICDGKFVYEHLYKLHMFKHTEKPYPCPHCEKGCTTKESLRRHLVTHSPNYVKKQHKCQYCEKTFRYPSFLYEHVKCHTGEKPYLCNECGRGFRQSGALDAHLVTHTGIKKFKCGICQLNYSSQSILNVHMQLHQKRDPLICDKCGKLFRLPAALKAHIKTHTEEKTKLCFVCGKIFHNSGALAIHLRRHAGEKPHVCSICNKSFLMSHLLTFHMRVHTGERPYKCTVCSAAFTRPSVLKSHLKKHRADGVLIQSVRPPDSGSQEQGEAYYEESSSEEDENDSTNEEQTKESEYF